MKSGKPIQQNLYQYLESLGILEQGTEEEISAAKKQYWATYKAAWRKAKRSAETEFITSWNDDELKILDDAAKRHHTSRTRFIKQATLAYIDSVYIVPDSKAVRSIAQLIGLALNSLQELIESDSVSMAKGKQAIDHFYSLEHSILSTLHNPKSLEQHITELLSEHPNAKEKILSIINTIDPV